MSNEATWIEVHYRCGGCGDEFSVGQPAPSEEDQVTLSLREEHEDCPNG